LLTYAPPLEILHGFDLPRRRLFRHFTQVPKAVTASNFFASRSSILSACGLLDIASRIVKLKNPIATSPAQMSLSRGRARPTTVIVVHTSRPPRRVPPPTAEPLRRALSSQNSSPPATLFELTARRASPDRSTGFCSY
jgi:hypothetical protein